MTKKGTMTKLEIARALLMMPDEVCVGFSCTGDFGSINAGTVCPFRRAESPACRQPPPGQLQAWIDQYIYEKEIG